MRTLPEPFQNHRILGTHRFEMTPFHFNGELYLLENFCDYDPADFAPEAYPPHTKEDGFLIRRLSDDKVISRVCGVYFASAYAMPNRVYAFGSVVEEDSEKTLHRIVRFETEDLINWSEPIEVYEAAPGCRVFNTSFAWDGEKFVGVYETDTPENLYKYIFKFWESSDLKNLKTVDGALYGLDKYVGANTIYFVDGFYYLLYLSECGNGCYNTVISRSKDLKNWQDSTIPVIGPDCTHEIDPEKRPGGMELNASDLELIEDKGKTIIYWLGGDQHGCCDMQRAEFNGSMAEFFRFYFSE